MGIDLRKASIDLGTVIDNVELRPGLIVSMVEDPDGNWVEFIDPGD